MNKVKIIRFIFHGRDESDCTLVRGVPRNFGGGGRGSTNSVEDTGQREWGFVGVSPLVRGPAQFANE
jgi:hypothetical protein